MSTEGSVEADPRRLVLVVARHSAAAGCPPGVDPKAFAAACLADSYELVSDLVSVDSGIAGEGPDIDDLLWPGAVSVRGTTRVREVVEAVTDRYDEVVLVPADVPDLPGLVIAKVFKALQRADVCLAPERDDGGGLVAVGLRVPWPSWLATEIDLDHNPVQDLQSLAPGRGRVAVGPDWHRMRSPAAIERLDPGLEGWEMTRSLLSGRLLHG